MNDDAIHVGVGVMIFNCRDEVFLAKRGPQARNERGHWEFPGGRVEYGETLSKAIQREIMEEFAMQIQVVAQLHLADHILPDEGQHWVSATFIAYHREGEPRIREPHKCSAIGWFALDNLPSPLSQISALDIDAFWNRPR